MDFHCDGKVNYSEFLAATISSINFSKEEKLWLTFKYFDTTDSGYITLSSVMEALKESGVVVDEKGLNETFANLKKKGEKITFNEFKSIAFDQPDMKLNDKSDIKDNISVNGKYMNNNNLNSIDENDETRETCEKNNVKKSGNDDSRSVNNHIDHKNSATPIRSSLHKKLY